MEFGAAIFLTDYAMGPVELGRALEERGWNRSGPLGTPTSRCRAESPFPPGQRYCKEGPLRRDGPVRDAGGGNFCLNAAEGGHGGLPGRAA